MELVSGSIECLQAFAETFAAYNVLKVDNLCCLQLPESTLVQYYVSFSKPSQCGDSSVMELGHGP